MLGPLAGVISFLEHQKWGVLKKRKWRARRFLPKQIGGGKAEARRRFVDRKGARYSQNHLFAFEKPRLVHRRVKGAVVYGKVQRPLLQLLLQAGCGRFVQAQLHTGIAFGKGAQQRGQHIRSKQHRTAQRQYARDAPFRVIQIPAQIRFDLQHLLRRADVGSPRLRKPDGRGAAVKDRRADSSLGLADHLTQGGLGNIERLCCPGEAALPVNLIHIGHLM